MHSGLEGQRDVLLSLQGRPEGLPTTRSSAIAYKKYRRSSTSGKSIAVIQGLTTGYDGWKTVCLCQSFTHQVEVMSMRNSSIVALILTLCCALPSVLFAQSPGPVSRPADVTAALGQQDLQNNEIVSRLAPIQSAADLQQYQVDHARIGSPLDRLSPSAKQRFLSSLTFSDKGLASFSYADLQDELTPSQIYQVLTLFGVQRTASFARHARIETDTDRMILGAPSVAPQTCTINSTLAGAGCDHEGYRCIERATCALAMQMICTSNC